MVEEMDEKVLKSEKPTISLNSLPFLISKIRLTLQTAVLTDSLLVMHVPINFQQKQELCRKADFC